MIQQKPAEAEAEMGVFRQIQQGDFSFCLFETHNLFTVEV
jgi:hypothetical protein